MSTPFTAEDKRIAGKLLCLLPLERVLPSEESRYRLEKSHGPLNPLGVDLFV